MMLHSLPTALWLLLSSTLVTALNVTAVTPLNATTPVNYTTSACNNSPLLCNRRYNTIAHLGAHDSAFLRDSTTGNSISGNQFYNATVALTAGVRLLQTQVQEQVEGDGVPWLCHSSCSLLNAGSLEPWLAKIKYWLDSNPSEVVTILIANVPNFPATAFKSAFENSGISQYAYEQNSTTASWPTLQTLINSNKRLVAFLSGRSGTATVPYLLDEFTYMFETPFTVTESAEFNCTLDRPKGETLTAALSAGKMPFMNHFLYDDIGFGIIVPNASYIATTNSGNDTTLVGNLGTASSTCSNTWSRIPSFLLVDFFDQGPAIDTVDRLNNITRTYNRVSPLEQISARRTSTNVGASVDSKLKLLVSEEQGGTVVKPGQWILAAGDWTGVTSGFNFQDL